jgi:hypothetical protein
MLLTSDVRWQVVEVSQEAVVDGSHMFH